MKHVDEFRDPALGQALAGEILGLVEPGRHYKFMEVCGGHTHSIYKFGIDDLLPSNVELVHGPGCPVCVIPMGRVDDAIALAHEDNVIFTCFGDMLRVPGSDGSLLDAKAEGADIRMVYSPLDALRIAKANPDRDVIFMAIGFETTAPSTALTLKRAKAEGVTNFFCMCNHVTIVPPLRALLDSPDLRLDGFIGPGHVSTVVGVRPFEFIPREYGKPISVAGFEPLDVLHAIHMLLTQLKEGRCEVENQYARVVPWEGNLRALQVMCEVFELRPHFEWRGMGFISQSGLKLSKALRRPRRRDPLRRPRRPRRRPEGLPVRRGAQGRHQAVGVQGLRHRAARRSARSARAWCPARAPAPRTTTTAGSPVSARSSSARLRSQSVSRRCSTSSRLRARRSRSSATRRSRWRTAPAARRRRASSRACSCRPSPTRRSRPMADAGTVDVLGGHDRDDDRQLRRQPDRLPRRHDRRPRRQRHDQRHRDGRCQAGRADAVAHPRRGPAGRRAQGPGRRDRRRRRRGRREHRRRRHEGRAARHVRQDVHLHDGHRRARRPRRTCRRRRCAPATRSSCPAGSAITARRSCSPAASSISTPTSRRTRCAFGRWSTTCWTKPVRRCAACATRPAAVSPRS